jgi:catechol 2,3-dioxygenase-like lactoylglutathione lyase family enzyme
MKAHLRIARPVSNLRRLADMYCAGLGLHVLGSFDNHDGFDGVMLGREGCDYHFEFTFCHSHPIKPQPSADDLVVFYLPDAAEWELACEKMAAAGFECIASFNPYWDVHGRTFVDPDGYRVVLQNAAWSNQESA